MYAVVMDTQSGVKSPKEMSPSLAKQRDRERVFLEQLLDTSKLDNYTVPVPIKADLRKYQQVSMCIYIGAVLLLELLPQALFYNAIVTIACSCTSNTVFKHPSSPRL